MKRFLLPTLALLAAGCASHSAPAPTPDARPTSRAATDVEPSGAVAAALVFQPTLPPAYPLEGLDRGPRQPSAFFGYEQGVTETYVVYTDDDQRQGGGFCGGFGRCGWGSGGWGGGYERRAISVKTGVVER